MYGSVVLWMYGVRCDGTVALYVGVGFGATGSYFPLVFSGWAHLVSWQRLGAHAAEEVRDAI